MRNYKLYIDIVDLFEYLVKFDIIEYRSFFMTVFVEAANPDDACHIIRNRIKRSIMKLDDSIEARIVCRRVNTLLRIDKIYSL